MSSRLRTGPRDGPQDTPGTEAGRAANGAPEKAAAGDGDRGTVAGSGGHEGAVPADDGARDRSATGAGPVAVGTPARDHPRNGPGTTTGREAGGDEGPGLPNDGDGSADTRHATCVAVGGRGLLILGASGSGKSALALRLLALGAVLVADDRVDLCRRGDAVMARAPAALAGLIEARGVGILYAPSLPEARVGLIVDLDREETLRLPPRRTATMCGIAVDLVFGLPQGHFAFALLQYLAHGRAE